MDLILAGRGQGKTTRLIQIAAAAREAGQNTYIVSLHNERARYVAQLARQMGLSIPFPLTYLEAQMTAPGLGVEALCLDDVDDFLRQQMREWVPTRPILAAALTHQPTMGYICAVCGAPAECNLVDLDTGATLTCNRCGGKTVVVLQSAETYP